MTKSGKHCCKRRNGTFLCNFFFCNYVFKKPSAAEASESVYMRERVKITRVLEGTHVSSANKSLKDYLTESQRCYGKVISIRLYDCVDLLKQTTQL